MRTSPMGMYHHPLRYANRYSATSVTPLTEEADENAAEFDPRYMTNALLRDVGISIAIAVDEDTLTVR